MGNIAVMGAGSWGTALAALLAKKGLPVRIWTMEKDVADEINHSHINSKYLPGVPIPDNLEACTGVTDIITNATEVVMSVPSQAFREVIRKIVPYINEEILIVNTAKGIEEYSLKRLSEVYAEETDKNLHKNFVVLSGPSHAEEVGREIPTTVVTAGSDRDMYERAQDLFMSSRFRVYTNPDVIGVELGGALKNIIAICTGISDGLGFGDNTKAALMTRGLAEISRLGIALGANPLTFAGLAGLGDLIVTCTSMHSRNRRFGIEIGQGRSVEEGLNNVRMVVEGYTTIGAAFKLAQQHDVAMPITQRAYEVLYQGENAAESVSKLMGRIKTHEMEEIFPK
jgi:glycerol-3-phosphate dehydrogenase (NAD(P)+)